MNDELRQTIGQIDKFDPEILKREGRDYEFTDVYSLIKEVYFYLEELKKNEDFLEILPEAKYTNLASEIKNFSSLIEQIANFDPQISNPQSVRDNLSSQLKANYNSLYDRLIQPIKIHLADKRSSKTGPSKIAKRIEKVLLDARQTGKEIDQLLKSAKKATAQVGFVEYSNIFKDQALEHKTRSSIWLKVSIGALILTIIYFFYIFIRTLPVIESGLDSFTTLTIFLAKAFPLTVLYYAIYQSVKNYNANMHLYTLNKHRENIIRTFESFIKSTDDPKIKDSLLKEAAKAIFSVGDTGYLSRKDGGEGADLIQIFNDLTKKGSS